MRSKPEDRKVSGLWHFRLGAVEQRAIQSGSRNWVAAWRSSSWLLGSSRWDAAPSRSGAGARTASAKRRSAKKESLPPAIKDVAAADNGADNPLRSLPLFLAAQQSRLLPRFGGKATSAAPRTTFLRFAAGPDGDLVALFASDYVSTFRREESDHDVVVPAASHYFQRFTPIRFRGQTISRSWRLRA